MAMRNDETEKYLVELKKAGVISQQDYLRFRSQEIADDNELTVNELLREIDFDAMSGTAWDAFVFASEAADVEYEARVPNYSARAAQHEESTSEFQALKGVLPRIGSALSNILDWGRAEEGNDAQARKDFVRALEERGYELPIHLAMREQTMEDVFDLAEKLNPDMPPNVLDLAVVDTETAINTRITDEDDTKKEQEDNEATDRTNEENPTYAKNLKAFQILDKTTPTKYKFDRETGAIYLTETGMQVDRRGNDIGTADLTGEVGAELVGGWPEGFIPGWAADPTGTGWGKMSAEIGVVVTEADYMDVLDVVNNKEWYGADPSRYVSGQAFLGGFEDSYRVKVEESDVMRRTKATMETLGGDSAAQSALGPVVWGAMRDDMQDTRRPWYDPMDNWAQFAGLSSENIAAVQSTMVGVGALDPDDIVSGVWGPAEAEQMHKWMTIANGMALQWTEVDEDILKEYFEEEERATTPRAAFVPDPYRPMDPAQVELTIRDSVRQLIGRDPTEEDLQVLGGYLTDQHSSSYSADVAAGRAQYNAQIAADEAESSFAQPGAVQDVDWESRFILEMEDKFAPQIESQERGALAGKQQDMGQAMSNMMSRLGGGIG